MPLYRIFLLLCLVVASTGFAFAEENNGEGFFLQSITKDGRVIREIEYGKSLACANEVKTSASYVKKYSLTLRCSMDSRKSELEFYTNVVLGNEEYPIYFSTLEYCKSYTEERKKSAEAFDEVILIDPCEKNENYINK